jgi:hypothetical protein
MSLLDTASLVVTPNGTKASKLYSVVPSSGAGDLSVTRATTATRVNSSGLIESVASNVPRLDYTNGSCPSILVEPQRTNLLTYSEEFNTSPWNTSNVSIVANDTASPNGTLTADKVICASGSSISPNIFYLNGISTIIGQSYKYTVYAKKGSSNFVKIRFSGSAFSTETNSPVFNLNTGVVVSGTGTINNIGNGWYRVEATSTATATTGAVVTIDIPSSTGVWPNGSFSGTEFIYLWGAQLEAGSYATSYIPTTSASVTRNADVISKTGISSLIGQTEGTLFVGIYDYNFTPNNTSPYVEIYSDSNNRILIAKNTSNQYQVVIRTSGVTVLNILTGAISGNTKIAVSYKENDCVVYVNGILVGTDTNVSVPTCNSLYLGESVTGTTIQKDVFNLTALWKTRLTNTQLAQLTTI